MSAVRVNDYSKIANVKLHDQATAHVGWSSTDDEPHCGLSHARRPDLLTMAFYNLQVSSADDND